MNILKTSFRVFLRVVAQFAIDCWAIVKAIDSATLWFFHKITNSLYRRTGVDNYHLAIVFASAALVASCFIAVATYKLAEGETNPGVASARQIGALLGPVFFGGFALMSILMRDFFWGVLQRKHDLGRISGGELVFGMFLRWFFLSAYFISLPYMLNWWGMFDTVLLSLGFMFMGCAPPDMNIRMKRAFVIME